MNELIIPLLSGTVLLLATWLKIYHERLKDIKSKLSDKKYGTYHEMLAILFDLISQTKGLKNVSDDELLRRIMDVKRDLILYGNDKMIRKFFEWEENQKKAAHRLWNWAELAAIARKDIGNSRTKIKADDILRSLFQNKDEYQDFKKKHILPK